MTALLCIKSSGLRILVLPKRRVHLSLTTCLALSLLTTHKSSRSPAHLPPAQLLYSFCIAYLTYRQFYLLADLFLDVKLRKLSMW